MSRDPTARPADHSWSSASRHCGLAPPAPAAAAQQRCATSRSTRASPASPAGTWTTCWTSSTTATCGCTESTWPGRPGGGWLLGSGDPVAVVRAEAVAYLRALSGRDDEVPLELVSGQASALTSIRQARVVF